MKWYLGVLKKYAVFGGRAHRQEYWMFFLFNMIIGYVLGFIAGSIAPESDQNLFVSIYSTAILIPAIAVAVRRSHDTDHSGWWMLVPIVNIFFLVSKGTQGDNRFGPDPKAISQTA